MGNRVSQYTIELDIAQGDKTRATVDGIERAVKGIADAARGNDLKKGMEAATVAARDLESQMQAIAASGDDATDAMAAYDKAAGKALSDLEKQATAINHALSEQGKAQRARIDEIEKELSVLSKTRENAEKRKALEGELRALKRDVVRGSDEELQAALQGNKAIRARLRMIQEQGKAQRAAKKIMQDAIKLSAQETKEKRTIFGLVKDDLAALKEKLKLQFSFISALKTTEGRYAAIKKAAGAALGGAGRLAKGAALGIGGAALAIGGAAMAGASAEVERERESARIKAPGMSADEKRDLLGQLYIETGADYTSIVDAINRVYGVLGTADRAQIMQATAAELRYPGAAALFRQQNVGAATAADFADYAGRMKALQGATGATVEQISAASGKIANMRQSSFRGASQADLSALYLALQGSGAYDEQVELDAAFARFVEAQSKSGKDLFEMAKTWDWGRGLDATNRQQAAAAIASVDWSRIAGAAREKGALGTSNAESMARKMRELEDKKNKILTKMLEAIAPVIDAIDINELSKFFESIIKIANALAPVVAKIVNFATDTLGKLVSAIEDLVAWLADLIPWADNPGATGATMSRISDAVRAARAQQMPQMASGGVASMPSIIGERGPEAVIPLDFSRTARAGNIMQNISQTFNMSGNETTTLSLANAVKSRGFQRSLGNAAWLNGRLGR